jgi:hypothetical protein
VDSSEDDLLQFAQTALFYGVFILCITTEQLKRLSQLERIKDVLLSGERIGPDELDAFKVPSANVRRTKDEGPDRLKSLCRKRERAEKWRVGKKEIADLGGRM